MDWFTAAGSIFQGMYDKSKQYQKEDFVLRAEELKAERDSLINRKNKKYDLELAAYYKENEKKKKIDSLNSAFAKIYDGADPSTNTAFTAYASDYLAATDDNFYKMDVNERSRKINNLALSIKNNGGKLITYDMQSQDPDKLANTLAAEEKLILKKYKDELQKSKDNNFLVNKVLGKSTTIDEKSLSDAVNAEKKASEIVIKTDEGNTTDDKEFVLPGEFNAIPPVKSKEFKTAYKDALKDTNFDIKGNNTFKFMNSLGTYGGADELSLKFNKTDSKIEGMNANGQAQVEFFEHMFNEVKKTKTSDNIFAITGEAYENVPNELNSDKVYSNMSSILDQNRHGNIKEDVKWGLGGEVRLTTFVPLNVADANGNLIINGVKVGNLDEGQMNTINGYLNNFLLKKTSEQKLGKSETSQGALNKNYRKLYKGEGGMLEEFNKYMLDNDPNLATALENAKTKINESTVTTEGSAVDAPKDGPEETNQVTGFTLGTNKDNLNSIVIPEDMTFSNGITVKKGDKIPLTPKNVELLQSENNSEINSLIAQGTKFGIDTDKNAPNLNIIPEFIRVSNKRGGTKLVPNPDHPKNKKKESTTTVRKINKKKIR